LFALEARERVRCDISVFLGKIFLYQLFSDYQLVGLWTMCGQATDVGQISHFIRGATIWFLSNGVVHCTSTFGVRQIHQRFWCHPL